MREVERQAHVGLDRRPRHQGGVLEDEAERRRLSPFQLIAPALGSVRPAMRRSAVLLPQPDGPTSETNSPSLTVKLVRVERLDAVREALCDVIEGEKQGQRGLVGLGGFASAARPLFTNAVV